MLGPPPGSWDAFSYVASSRHVVGARGHAQTMSLQKDLGLPWPLLPAPQGGMVILKLARLKRSFSSIV